MRRMEGATMDVLLQATYEEMLSVRFPSTFAMLPLAVSTQPRAAVVRCRDVRMTPVARWPSV